MTTWQYVDEHGRSVGQHTYSAPLVGLQTLRLNVQETSRVIRQIPGDPMILRGEHTRTEIFWGRFDNERCEASIRVLGNPGTSIEVIQDALDKARQLCGVTVVDLRPKLLGLPDLSGPWERLKFLIGWICRGSAPAAIPAVDVPLEDDSSEPRVA